MNILMLNHNRIWEGTFNRAFYFGRSLVKLGHSVKVVTNSKYRIFSFNEFEHEGIKIIETPDLLWGKLRTGWDLVNVLRRIFHLRLEQLDIIHAFDCRPTVIIPALYLKKHFNMPLIIDWADWWGRKGAISLRKAMLLNRLFEPVETYFEENFRKYADYTTVISSLLKERAINLGIDKKKIRCIHHGSDIKNIYPVNKQDARRRLNLPLNPYILIYSGFIQYDVDIVQNAFDLVLKEFPETLLILTGKKNIIKSHSRNKEVTRENILDIGFVPKSKFLLYLAASDLCLMPLSNNLANRARFPGRIGDYMAAGKAIISNPVGEAAQIIKEFDLGLLTEPTALSFARGIITALKDEISRKRWGINSRTIAEKKFSFDILCKEFERVYFEVLKKT